MKWISLVLLANVLTSTLYAGQWQRHEIPDTACADGSPYAIFIQEGKKENLYIKFSGGNACWDYKSCYEKKYTNLTSVIEAPANFMTDNIDSPVIEDTKVLFTYCTGDVHIGEHIAQYEGMITRHSGKQNIEKAMDFIDQYFNGLNQFEQVVVHGLSAGAMGLLYHIHNMDQYTMGVENRVAIIDGAGLHFGDEFWNRFPEKQIQDYTKVLEINSVSASPLRGNISQIVPNICSKLNDWRIAALQTSKDIVMTWFFGEISMGDHKKLVYSDFGMLGHTQDPTDNCIGFLPDSKRHTLLSTDKKSGTKSENYLGQKKTASAFAADVILGLDYLTYYD